ncbi:galactose-specific lectin nattectin-like [Morone saxatilis]|uniref:galactose-specific lectin nattectin-like n=1 Tax=Morone saxatilis TaxID=34816 RepID=UPI0015E22BBC|nr:galactose-specific lectin nattectin-like [Morone saxatilis]
MFILSATGITTAKMASGFHLAFFLCLVSGLLIAGTVGSTRISRSADCPSGWSRYGSRCFNVFTDQRSMADAELICIAHGGNLASIHNIHEHYVIRNLIHQRYQAYVNAWIGHFDAIQEGRWMWTDGSGSTFRYWAHGEPNNHGGEHCTEINFRGNAWNDEHCNSRRPFVCARKV